MGIHDGVGDRWRPEPAGQAQNLHLPSGAHALIVKAWLAQSIRPGAPRDHDRGRGRPDDCHRGGGWRRAGGFEGAICGCRGLR
eukprot:5338317-Pyramimonas_sp.AAC.1